MSTSSAGRTPTGSLPLTERPLGTAGPAPDRDAARDDGYTAALAVALIPLAWAVGSWLTAHG